MRRSSGLLSYLVQALARMQPNLGCAPLRSNRCIRTIFVGVGGSGAIRRLCRGCRKGTVMRCHRQRDAAPWRHATTLPSAGRGGAMWAWTPRPPHPWRKKGTLPHHGISNDTFVVWHKVSFLRNVFLTWVDLSFIQLHKQITTRSHFEQCHLERKTRHRQAQADA